MKRILMVVLFSVLAFAVAVDSKETQKPPCAPNIDACALTGCSPDNHHDPKLNRVKNIASSNGELQDRSVTWMKNLDDPGDFSSGDDRDELQDLGEGDKIRVVGYVLIVRDEPGGESCNCYLHDKEQTDNHLVLVTRTTVDEFPLPKNPNQDTRKTVLDQRERESVTAEFTPRVRKNGHPNFLRAKTQPLIDAAPQRALRVRLTGQLTFDSEHFIRHHLKRVNNWEIHPILKFEYCPNGKTCKKDSDDNWEDLDAQP